MSAEANLLLVSILEAFFHSKKVQILFGQNLNFRWQLAGGDVHSELKAVGLIRNEAPILTMPK